MTKTYIFQKKNEIISIMDYQKNRITAVLKKIEKTILVRVVREALASMIPVVMIGAFALIIKTLPIEAYQRFITSFASGFIFDLVDIIFNATFGVLSVYMTYFVSRCYMRMKADTESVYNGAVIASLVSFFILAGIDLVDFSTECTNAKSMFLAIVAGFGASSLYIKAEKFFRNRKNNLYSSGADYDFNRTMSTLFPIMTTVTVFALIDLVIIRIFNVGSFRMLIIEIFNSIFAIGSNYFVKGFCFVLLSSLLWFFGIHGSDILENVMQTYFAPGLAANQAAVASGLTATNVLTKSFFDCFVLMGGCGSTICLLIAILLFSKNSARKGLAYVASFPMLFNINELMVFGLPIIYNPTMLMPFICVPLINYTISYYAISSGIVPMIINEAEWTTPIILGGYKITGSVTGSVLQLVNLVIGVAIYMVFIKALDEQSIRNAQENFNDFIDYFKKNESDFVNRPLTQRHDKYGEFAKNLCAEVKNDMDSQIILAYQPQYGYDGKCMGAEALLRWKHPVHGMLYPPLVIRLAEEGGFLPELEEEILKKALSDRDKVLEKFGKEIKLSVNVTGTTVVTSRYMNFIKSLNEKRPFEGMHMCIEVTEQAALNFDENTHKALKTLKDMGLMLAIDDFSMGQTSINYMKDNLFDIVKLDGSLVKGLFEHQNTREIISSIVSLASSIDMLVLAEYVETEEQKEELHKLGCDCYQGYLYSPAVKV